MQHMHLSNSQIYCETTRDCATARDALPALLQGFALSCGAPISTCPPELPHERPPWLACALAALLTSLPTSRCSAAAAVSERLAYVLVVKVVQ